MKTTTQSDVSLALPLFYGFYIVLNAVMAHHLMQPGVISDFSLHNYFAQNVLETGFDISNLYWNMVAFLSQTLSVDIATAAKLTVFIMQIAFIIPIHFYVSKYLKNKVNAKWICLIVATTGLFGSIPNLFGPNLYYYYTFGARVWHNPTTFTVLPFAVISFFMFCNCIYKANSGSVFNRKWVLSCLLLSIVLFLSAYGKSSWLPPFAMGSLIFLIIWWVASRFNKTRFWHCITIGISFIPAGLYILWISSNVHGIPFVFGLSSVARPFLIILNLLFPLLVIILREKSIHKNVHLQMAWFVYLSALLQGLFIIEYGHEIHGNIFWGFLYAYIILFLISLIEFVKWIHEDSRNKFVVYAGLILIFTHLFSGIFYAFHILNGGSFWF